MRVSKTVSLCCVERDHSRKDPRPRLRFSSKSEHTLGKLSVVGRIEPPTDVGAGRKTVEMLGRGQLGGTTGVAVGNTAKLTVLDMIMSVSLLIAEGHSACLQGNRVRLDGCQHGIQGEVLHGVRLGIRGIVLERNNVRH